MSQAARRFFSNRTGIVGTAIVGLLVVIAIMAPLIANDAPVIAVIDGTIYFPALFDYDAFDGADWKTRLTRADVDFVLMPPVPFNPVQVDLTATLLSPGERGHLLGTDNLGCDIFARIIHGSRIALSVGIVAMGIAALIGILLGSLAGYFGGATDMAISRIIEIVICFPLLFLILTVLAFLPPSIYNIMIVIGITGWTGIARLVRGEILKVREMDYIKAAKNAGLPSSRIILRHVLPNSLAPVFVSISFGIAGSILTETGLSFLGFGVQPPDPSWGQILSLAREYPSRIWLTVFPGLAIFITVTGYNMIGEALRDALDPRLARGRE